MQASNLQFSQRLTGMEQRLAGIDLDFGKKMENIFKTLSNVFENIN